MAVETSPQRLVELLRELIDSDGLGPGDQLPTEPALAERFGVSRTKVREALKLIERDGVVRAVQGRGRFVSPLGALRVERPMTVYEGIGEMLAGRGWAVTTVVLEVGEAACDEPVARALSAAVGDPVIRLVRLRLGDGVPLVFSINAIVRDALPGPVDFRDWSTSLTAALAAHGNRVVSSAARVTATNVPEPYAGRHRLGRLDPWLLVEEACVTDTGRRVMHALDYHRGSEIGFHILRRRQG
jgi:GntR family transcriptional regulator